MGKPFEGSLGEYVSKHLHLTNPEILALPDAAEHGVTGLKQISNTRNRLKGKGITKSVRRAKKKASAPRPAANGTEPQFAPKEAALRALIFELGFDKARAVFDEFDQLHQRMRGGTDAKRD